FLAPRLMKTRCDCSLPRTRLGFQASLFRSWNKVSPMDLNEIVVFTRVVQAGSFTAAARLLEMPKSSVSRKVSELEDRGGARLIQRTTGKLGLTDAGRTYYEYAARIVAQIEEADQAVSRMQAEPRGLLRVTAPLSFAMLGPIVAEFMKRNPEVQVELTC